MEIARLYACGIDPALVIAAVLVLVFVLSVARMAWRILRHNEEMQAGGSLSHQMFGRTKNKKRATKKPR